MTRPQRHGKDDRLLHRGATEAEVRCDLATGPFDRVARAMDRKWGQDRLPELVSPEMASRWGKAMSDLNAALDSGNVDLVVQKVNACLRGFAAMDREATAAGHKPIPPEALEVEVDGVVCAILADGNQWPVYAALRPGLRIYTLREVGNALAAYGASVAAVKDLWPGAEVVAVRKPTKLEEELQDSIPF